MKSISEKDIFKVAGAAPMSPVLVRAMNDIGELVGNPQLGYEADFIKGFYDGF